MFSYMLSDFQNAFIRPNRLENRATFDDFSLSLSHWVDLTKSVGLTVPELAQLIVKPVTVLTIPAPSGLNNGN